MTPDFEIRLSDGQDVTAAVRRSFTSLRLTTTADRTSDGVDVVLSAAPAALAAPARGRRMRVKLGYTGSELRGMGEFVHTETEVELVFPRVLRGPH